jgi:hypothetical protein
MTSSQKLVIAHKVQKLIASILEDDGEPLKDLEVDNDENYYYAVECLAKIVQKLKAGTVITKELI